MNGCKLKLLDEEFRVEGRIRGKRDGFSLDFYMEIYVSNGI